MATSQKAKETINENEKAAARFRSGTYSIDLRMPYAKSLAKAIDNLPPTNKKVNELTDLIVEHLTPEDVISLAERLKFKYRVGRTVEAVEYAPSLDKGQTVRIISGKYMGQTGVVSSFNKIRCQVNIPDEGSVYLFTSEVSPIKH